jgi:nicotinamide-nucleotide amidase
VSVTGIAGPTGARPGKPVGTTYVALVGPSYEQVERFVFAEDRSGNRAAAVRCAMDMILGYFAGRDNEQAALTGRDVLG